MAPSGSRAKSGYKGVSFSARTGGYQAQIQISGSSGSRHVYIASFRDGCLAARAYDLVALLDRGPTADTNFPPDVYDGVMEHLQGARIEDVTSALQAFTRIANGSRKSSRYVGVSRKSGKTSSTPWEAYLHHSKAEQGRPMGQRKQHLGVFETEEEAGRAVDRACVAAGLPPPNFPPEREVFGRHLFDFLELYRAPAPPPGPTATAPAAGKRKAPGEGSAEGRRLTPPYRQRRRGEVFVPRADPASDSDETTTDGGEDKGGEVWQLPADAAALRILAEAVDAPPTAPGGQVAQDGNIPWEHHLAAASDGLLRALLPEGRAAQQGPRAAVATAIVTFLGDLMGRLEGAGERLTDPGGVLRRAGGGLLPHGF